MSTSKSPRMKRISAQLHYAVGKNKTPLILIGFLVFIILVSWLIAPTFTNDLNTDWSDKVDPAISIITLIVAIAIWWQESSENWINSLPKKLTVRFIYQGKVVMLCKRAYLSGEGDIRPLGQQIGTQMAENPRLDLRAPAVKQTNPGPGLDPDSGEFSNFYEAEFELRALVGKMSPDLCLVWEPPFGDVDTIECDKLE
ncbi:MAG: hypothetical protein R3F53_14385 [Gammaproteobacteria bacterium]